LFSLHLLQLPSMHAPTALNDELTYLGFARFFSGTAALPNEPGSAFGAFGYSLLIAPAFWCSHSFSVVYKVVLLINALLMSSCYFLLYRIAVRVFGASRSAAIIGAFVCAAYPSFLLFSDFAISENAFIPAFLLFCLVSFDSLHRPSLPLGIGFGALAGFLYMLHARSLGILALSLLLQIYAVRRRWSNVTVLCGFVASAVVVIAGTRFVAPFLIHQTGLVELTPGWTILRTLSPAGVWHAAVAFSGQVLYNSVASCGLFPLGLLAALARVRNGFRTNCDNQEQRTQVLMAFWSIAAISVMAVSALFLAAIDPTLDRPDFIVNGRYGEGVTAVFMLVGVLELLRGDVVGLSKYRVGNVISIVVLMCIIVVTPDWRNTNWLQGPGPRIGMFSLMSMLRLLGDTNIALVGVAGLAIVLAILALARWKRILAVSLIGVAFIGSAWLEFRTDILPDQNAFLAPAGSGRRDGPLALIDRLSRLKSITEIGYDLSTWHPFTQAYYQLWQPRKTFVVFNSASGDQPRSYAVIAGRMWGGRATYTQMQCETMLDACLYVKRELASAMIDPVRLGADIAVHDIPGVTATGVYPLESSSAVPFRWTNGRADLRIPGTAGAPRKLAIGIRVPRRQNVRISVNETDLYHGSVDAGVWRQALTLPPDVGSVRRVVIGSETFIPPAVNGYTRTLGVQLLSVCILGFEDWCETQLGANIAVQDNPAVAAAGVYPLESWNTVPFRWTNGKADLRISSAAGEPRKLAVDIRVPRRQNVRIAVNETDLYDGSVDAGEWRQVFTLPRDAGSIRRVLIASETFVSPAVNGYTRTLGVQLLSVCILGFENWCDTPEGSVR